MAKIEMTIDSIRVSLVNYQRVVILKEKTGERYLPIWIGPAEADMIAVKMQNVSVPRPLFADFVCMIIDSLGGRMKEALISELRNDTFYAKAIINVNKKDIEIDCRPSDVLAVAVRLDTSIFTEEKVLKKAGITLDPETGEPISKSSGVAFSSGTGNPESSHFEVFSESARAILNQSESESKRLNHDMVSTGHVLLALLKGQGYNILAGILNNMNIDMPKFLEDLESILVTQPAIEGNETGLTPAVKEAIQTALTEAKRLGSVQVEPEHILLSLLRGNNGIAINRLKNADVTTEKIYIELLRIDSQRIKI